MNTVLVSGYGIKISIKKGLIVISDKNNGKKTIGLADIDQLIIATSGVLITSSVLRKLLSHGVDIVILDSSGLPIGRLYPPFISKTIDTRRSQYVAYNEPEIVKKLILEFITSKVYNQVGHLRRLAKQLDKPGLRELAYNLLNEYLDKISNLHGSIEYIREKIRIAESIIAQKYWEALATTIPDKYEFTSRKPGEGEDIVNRCIDYMYGLLYSEIWKILVLAGLDPYAGFMHIDRSGKPVLVYDFVEMFRASCVDYPLFSTLRNYLKPEWKDSDSKLLAIETRRELIKILKETLDRRVSYRGLEYRCSLRSAIARKSYELASYLRKEIVDFKGFIEEW